ncbi:cobaltochelatase subunit CobN [Methanofervidicoccus abyssi]|uniref:Cobaltochelatase CobN n=1 Tax=Methanofervidicoccus abyssi TaxID=2082189 RepID=A0A401HQJ2_9EURY|nr:cobaltochelatase subunit CobN [Methanofervidicoccus abyssi]GBF36509.1 cobaltochelatase CobN [Methanofervidicoccus abyssi]
MKSIKITTLMWASYCSILDRAYKSLKKFLRDNYNVDLQMKIYSTRDIEEKFERFLRDTKESHLVLIYRISSEIYDRIPILENSIVIGQDPQYWNSKLSPKAYLYTVYGGIENFKNLILYLLANSSVVESIEYSEPLKFPFQGIYLKEDGNIKIYENLQDFLKDKEFNKKYTVGVLFSRHYLINEDMEVIDMLIDKLEEHFNVIPVFTYGAKDEDLGAWGSGECVMRYFFKDNKPVIDALINLLSFPLGTTKEGGALKKMDGVDILKKLDVPVFHPVVSYYKSYEEWERDKNGLSFEIGWNVALPELEGVIEPIIVGTTEKVGCLEKKKPIEDRIDKLVRRIKRWTELKYKDRSDRKVIFILHSNACASLEATVGSAAHLDTFQSLINIMRRLKENGYTVENIPESGDQLAKMILEKKAISEFRWTSVEEIVSKGGALYLMDESEYWKYFNSLPEEVKRKVLETWKDLNTGGMVYRDRDGRKKIVITGLRFGNIYVAVQPKRGCVGARCDGSVCKILHDPECPPTHHYIATYRYFNEIGDVIVHVGTHGSLEFLPGKNVGLSGKCYPDILIDDIPHIYIYNSDNPPEGTVAKRRSYSTLIDHMQVLMIDAFPSELEKLSNYVEEYLKEMDISRRHQLEHLILEEVKRVNIINLSKRVKEMEKKGTLHEEFKEIFQDIRNALEILKSSKCNDGMHVFGTIPEGERRVEYIYSILEFKHGRSKRLRKDIEDVISGRNIEDRELKEKILDINKRIEDSREIDSLLRVFDGRYIEPGPSGLITRGKIDILPTGRNFYSLDPYTIPTEASYRVGCILAEKLIHKYLEEEGRYPENVAIYWMCSDIMWSDGEVMAQILYLLGVKPRWRKGKVVGVDIIPLEELKRPRIDVTLRVSGILRDNFPNCMDIVDEAIVKVAKLEEPPEMNFVRKHVLEGIKEGLSFREATYRIFSSKPGTYGNGVKYAIYASAWENEEDLKDAFVLWNSYAYGKGVYGEKAKRSFEMLLKTVDVTYNKVVSDEYDLLGCCCYFGVHGGLINAVKVISGKDVKSYYGDTRRLENITVRTLKEEIERVTLSKLLNPKWIESMERHGYKGVGDISKRIGRVFGWSATTKEVDSWIFDGIYSTFIKDEKNREFFKRNNPYALEEIGRRLLEAYQRGLWNTDEETVEDLKRIYMEVEGYIEDTYDGIDMGDIQGGSIDISMEWKEKLIASYKNR